MSEELLVGSVHLGEVGHVGQENLRSREHSFSIARGTEDWGTYVDLDNLGNAGTSSVQDGLDVVAASLGQDTDVALDQVGRGVSGNLAGDEDHSIGTDGLGLLCVSLLHDSLRAFDCLVLRTEPCRVHAGKAQSTTAALDCDAGWD